MARYTGPTAKIARRFGEAIFGPSKALKKKAIRRVSMEKVVVVKYQIMQSS